MSMSKSSKMLQYINYRMRVTMQDGRQLVGKFMAFDRHMNLVLGDCEEFRRLPPKKGKGNEEREDRRTLGFVLLRGEEVVSMTVEGPPPQEESRAKANAAAQPGPGLGRAAGRGMAPILSQAQPGLQGPVRGVGGPAPGMMQPQMNRPSGAQVSAAPVSYQAPPGQMRPGDPAFPGRPVAPPPGVRMMQPGMMPPGGVPQFRPGMPPGMAPPQAGFGQRPMMRGPPPPGGMAGPPRPGMPAPPPAPSQQRPAMYPPRPMPPAPQPPQQQQQQQQPPQQQQQQPPPPQQ